MKRFVYSVALVLALILASLPAIADHITEPQSPMVKITLGLSDYSNPNAPPIDCTRVAAPFSTASFNNLRANAFVKANRASAADPSEHFEITVEVWTDWDAVRAEGRPLWAARWGHQNMPPHSSLSWRAMLSTDYNMQDHPGLWRVLVTLIGDESGVVLTDDCIFEKVNS